MAMKIPQPQGLLLIFLANWSIAHKHVDTKPLQVTLDDNSRHSTYGWKISSDVFHYFQDVQGSSLNIPSISSVDMSPLNLETVHGIWVLEKDKEDSAKKFFDQDSDTQAYFRFSSSSQLYDSLEITACLYGNSYLNITAHSKQIILKDKCNHDKKPHWKTFTVSLGGSGQFTVEAFIPSEDDFLIIDKFIASRQSTNHNINDTKRLFDEAHLMLKETTPDCN